jgi:hypothetical protein
MYKYRPTHLCRRTSASGGAGIRSAEGKAVIYFNSIEQMIEKARWLRESDGERQRLAESLHNVITGGNHT